MAVPRNKVTPSRRDQRRAHDAIRPVGYVDCPNCGEHKLSHHICSSCGHYRDREVIDTGDAL